jgi:phage-related protein
MAEAKGIKPVRWIGSSLKDLQKFPDDVQDAVGFALHQAQTGGKSLSAKPLNGFGGAGVLEIVEDYEGDTYRAVYTVKFADAVYVLHSFQKKSKKGSKTPATDINLVKTRLAAAEADFKARKESRK